MPTLTADDETVTPTPPFPHFQKLLDVGEVAKVFATTKATIYKRVKDGLLPKPIKTGKRTSRWLANDVQKVFDAICAEKSPDGIKQIVNEIHASRAALKEV